MAGDLVSAFEEFLGARQQDLAELAQAFPGKRSVAIDFSELEKFDPGVADELLEKPDEVGKAAETAVARFDYPTASGKPFAPHVRFFNLPETSDVEVQDLGAEQLDRLSRVEGVVSWITEIKPLMKTARWECLHCGAVIKNATEKTSVRPPGLCKCGHREFRLVEESSEFINIQRANMQEPVEKLKGSAPATHIELWMEDDLVNTIAPGEKLSVTGVLRLRPIREGRGGGRSSVYGKFLDVLHIQKQEREFEEISVSKEEEKQFREMAADPRLLELVTKSIAPSIYGYDELKQAIALQLFGGTPAKVLPDGKKIRSDLHVLLIGDPGTAKSVTLQYINQLAPKSVFVSGGGASGVGLTAAAEKETDGEGWILKAGAMVLASGGIAIIDEFDKMTEDDRGLIHEAMEQQQVSIAKAGIVTQFQSRTAVLAAANPKLGRFDSARPPAEQFNISPALLSRFDLIFTIRDVLDESRDRKMADHILLGHKIAGDKTVVVPEESPILPAIPPAVFQKYVAYARKNVFPVLSEPAMERIKEFYIDLRRLGAKQGNYPITARQIEAIVRLSEASAKMRLSPTVESSDAERAIGLVNYVLNEVFVDKETGRIDSDVINIGQPKSRTDRIRSLLAIIGNLEKKVDLVATEDVVKEAVTSLGIDEYHARQLIDVLKRQGDLYEPKAGFIKSARRREW